MLLMPDLLGLTIEDAEKVVKDLDIEYLTNKNNMNAKVNQQYPAPGVLFRKEGNKILFYSTITDKIESDLLPDFRNTPIRRAIEFCIRKNIKVDTQGKGVIYKQSIPPGTKITEEMELVIKCR